MGPTERTIRARLLNGQRLSRGEIARVYGVLGRSLVSKWLRRGIADEVDGVIVMRVQTVPKSTTLLHAERRIQRERVKEQRAVANERAATLAERDAERRVLLEEIRRAPTAEDANRIAQEHRVGAFAERVIARLVPSEMSNQAMESLFGIEIDQSIGGV